ncbi:DNA ligase/mRNA capping enzyme [Coprinellus micaceus]|uniref:mRNA guanylyltransferase n=1 Tax=Coprinellus micaceus TaxID=71717 RepID=A0A4Y7R5K7_COPMI|nr:DNA ligase/mRNA capping enzyme [Coprinellus micaceus]
MSAIPDLPGNTPQSSEQETLKTSVAKMCKLKPNRCDFTKLEQHDFWVCEKSDGVRALLLITFDSGSNTQAVFLIDRRNTYRKIEGFYPRRSLGNSLIDGELVMAVDPETHQVRRYIHFAGGRTVYKTRRFLAFDCLVIDDQNVMTQTLDKRYGRLKEWFYRPFSRMAKDPLQAFDIHVKSMVLSYKVSKVFTMDIPNLMHRSDGLVYSRVTAPYKPGTDQNMHWRPPSENSVSFKLVLQLPLSPAWDDPGTPDPCAKPLFLLSYEHFNDMYVSDDEWEQMKLSGEKVDGRIVKVRWDPSLRHWRMMRFRDDKAQGNHKSVVNDISQSIAEGIEKDDILARSNAIRNAWKSRQRLPIQPASPVRQQLVPPNTGATPLPSF